MKYMLLIQFSEAQVDFPAVTSWAPGEVKAHIEHMQSLNKEIQGAGEWIDGQGLAMPQDAKVVRAGADRAPVISDGPFPETKEFLAGFWIVDVEAPERAYEIAAIASAAPGPGGKPVNMPIEVREIMAAPAVEEL